jgi:cytochrome c oxidase subunit 1
MVDGYSLLIFFMLFVFLPYSIKTINYQPITKNLFMDIFSSQNPNFKYAKNWFLLGVVCLAIAGLFAVLLVGARSPVLMNIIPYKDFFRTALIVHVNLSVFVWLTAFTASLWSLGNVNCKQLEYFYFFGAVLGAALMAISPFLDEGNPLLNNYYPMLQNIYFQIGLGLFATSVLLKNISYLMFGLKSSAALFGFATYVLALISFASFAHFFFSLYIMFQPTILDLYNSEDFYNRLYWASGHILQYSYTQLIVICWVFLSMIIGFLKVTKTGLLKGLFAINFLLVLPTFLVYNKYEITSFEFMNYFTKHMISGGGVAATFAFLLVAGSYIKAKIKKTNYLEGADLSFLKPISNNLLWSIILFGAGGIIGFLITHENTKVPAHYHGSIVAISIAAMGLAFYMMPKFGYAKITGGLANWQGGLYGFGQLLHIIGFAISGGYGALRKTPAVMQSFEGKAAMGLMGLGGLISIIGGLIFVVVVIKSIKNK